MDVKALKYLNVLTDKQQYPGTRCGMSSRNVFMYQCSVSLLVESMNRTNQSVHARTAVDVVCSTTLLLAMSADRYQDKKEEAWKWKEPLTPYGIKLRDAAFKDINYRLYWITIEEATVKWICRVTRVGKGHKEWTCFFLKELEEGSVFGGCICMIPYTNGMPCHHMVAVVKSS
jgi:hypothetical protein